MRMRCTHISFLMLGLLRCPFDLCSGRMAGSVGLVDRPDPGGVGSAIGLCSMAGSVCLVDRPDPGGVRSVFPTRLGTLRRATRRFPRCSCDRVLPGLEVGCPELEPSKKRQRDERGDCEKYN